MTIDKNRVMIARKRLGRHDQQEVALLCDIVEGWGANLNADKRKVLDQLIANVLSWRWLTDFGYETRDVPLFVEHCEAVATRLMLSCVGLASKHAAG